MIASDLLNKQKLRKQFFEKFISETASSQRKLKKNLYLYLNSRSRDLEKLDVMAYKPFPTEPSILKILRELKIKNIYLPPIYGRCKKIGFHGLWKEVYRLDFLIAPALLIQKNGFRLGRGIGFYDRILSYFDFRKTIFAGYDWQVKEKLPIEKHDRRVSAIVTESSIMCCYH